MYRLASLRVNDFPHVPQDTLVEVHQALGSDTELDLKVTLTVLVEKHEKLIKNHLGENTIVASEHHLDVAQ